MRNRPLPLLPHLSSLPLLIFSHDDFLFSPFLYISSLISILSFLTFPHIWSDYLLFLVTEAPNAPHTHDPSIAFQKSVIHSRQFPFRFLNAHDSISGLEGQLKNKGIIPFLPTLICLSCLRIDKAT